MKKEIEVNDFVRYIGESLNFTTTSFPHCSSGQVTETTELTCFVDGVWYAKKDVTLLL